MHISSVEQLNQVTSDLHDCPFDLDRVLVDEAAQTWTGFFLRPLWDDPRAEHRGFSLLYVRSQLPLAEVTLQFSGVRNCVVADNARIGRYTFNRAEIRVGGVRLHFHEELEVDLDLEGVDATYEERPLPALRAVYRQVFLVQSGPSIERLPQNTSLDRSHGKRVSHQA